MKEYSIFEYLYRDASNYKAWGSLVLEGGYEPYDLQVLESKFDAGSYFIAEQLCIPSLHAQLWHYSDGPTTDDHVWHEFCSLRLATKEDTIVPVFSSVRRFVDSVGSIDDWKPKLNPHWRIY